MHAAPHLPLFVVVRFYSQAALDREFDLAGHKYLLSSAGSKAEYFTCLRLTFALYRVISLPLSQSPR